MISVHLLDCVRQRISSLRRTSQEEVIKTVKYYYISEIDEVMLKVLRKGVMVQAYNEGRLVFVGKPPFSTLLLYDPDIEEKDIIKEEFNGLKIIKPKVGKFEGYVTENIIEYSEPGVYIEHYELYFQPKVYDTPERFKKAKKVYSIPYDWPVEAT